MPEGCFTKYSILIQLLSFISESAKATLDNVQLDCNVLTGRYCTMARWHSSLVRSVKWHLCFSPSVALMTEVSLKLHYPSHPPSSMQKNEASILEVPSRLLQHPVQFSGALRVFFASVFTASSNSASYLPRACNSSGFTLRRFHRVFMQEYDVRGGRCDRA